jgi:AcrR family transcriptional regulator
VLEDREYHDVTMDDVSRRAGLAKGSLYLHFPTKERLFRELVEDMHAELLESLDRVRGSSAPGEPRVRALIAAQLGFFERHRGVFLQVFQGQMPFLCGDARRSRDMVGATLRVTTDVIEEAVRLRRFRSLDGPTAAIGLFGLIRGFVFAHILCGSSPALGSRAGVIWDLFFRGARA